MTIIVIIKTIITIVTIDSKSPVGQIRGPGRDELEHPCWGRIRVEWYGVKERGLPRDEGGATERRQDPYQGCVTSEVRYGVQGAGGSRG